MYVQTETIKIMRKELKNFNKSFVAEYIKDECFNKNSNFIGIWVGKPGSGKSVSALRMCEVIDPKFTINNVVFSIQELLKAVEIFQNLHEKGVDIRGSCILYDEAGVSADNRQWQDKLHKALNDSIEIFRFLNLVLMITVPGRNRIDKKFRELIHGQFYPYEKGKDYRMVKFFLFKQDMLRNIEYNQYLKMQTRGWISKIKSLRVKKPRKELFDAYEKRMLTYKRKILTRSLKQVTKTESPNPQKKALSKRQEQVYILKKKNYTNTEIAKMLGISIPAITVNLQAARYKGWQV